MAYDVDKSKAEGNINSVLGIEIEEIKEGHRTHKKTTYLAY